MTLRDRAIESAGLSAMVARRENGETLGAEELALAARSDLLALGAAADRVRRADVGDDVWIHAGAPSPDLVLVRGEGQRGTTLFRKLALARLGSPRGARLCVDLEDVGLPVAQVALSFGVSDLAGLSSKRGLPVVGEGAKTRAVKDEISGYVTRAKRTAVFVEADSASTTPRSP